MTEYSDPDFEIISIRPRELTPREQEIRVVSQTATKEGLQRLQNASDLKDWLTWQRAVSVYFDENNISWMWDYGGTAVEDLLAEPNTEVFSKIFEKETKVAQELKTKMDTTEPRENMFRIVLKRVRNERGYYNYRALVAFPKGIHAEDSGEGFTPHVHSGDIEMIYFEPQQACTEHACDDLFKEKRDMVFYVPYVDLGTAIQRLQKNKDGINEYLLDKTEQGSVKQDALNYILVAVLGGYSNEKYYARISDFWRRNE